MEVSNKKKAVMLTGYDNRPDDKLVKLRDVVILLAVSIATVRKLVRQGILTEHRPYPRKVYYNMGEIRRYLASLDEEIDPLYVVCGSPEWNSVQYGSFTSDKDLYEYAAEVERLRNSQAVN